MSRPPNILYLMSEHTKFSATSLSGNPHVPCRFFDQMASNGITFTNVYSASPVCTPSRTTVSTGVHPLVHQVTCHQNRAPHNLTQLPEILQQNGYYTAVTGHYELSRNLGRGWHEQADFREPGPLRRSSDFWHAQGSWQTPWKCGTLDCALEETNAYLLTDRAIQMLDGARAAKTPFFLHVSYAEPDPPHFVPAPYDTRIDPRAVPPPERGDDRLCAEWLVQARKESGTGRATAADLSRLVAFYYATISMVSDQMQRLYEAVAERGMLENTWIIYASDHGEYVGEKGLIDQSESLYECLLHVPLVIVPPSDVKAPRGTRISGFVDNVDTFPTLLQIAGLDVPEYAQGKDLMSWVQNGSSEPLHDCVFAQIGDYHGTLQTTLPAGIPASGRRHSLIQGARTTQYAYVRDPEYGDEAYDLGSDPKELISLLRNKGEKEPSEIGDLRRQLDRWEDECLRLRDRLDVIPGDRGFDKGWE